MKPPQIIKKVDVETSAETIFRKMANGMNSSSTITTMDIPLNETMLHHIALAEKV